MKIHFSSLILLALLLLPVGATAQADSVAVLIDTREPGIYAVVGDQSVKLPYQRSTIVSYGTDFIYASEVYYKGAHAKVVTDTRTFLLVVSTKKSTFTVKNPFVKGLTPIHMRFLPLVTEEKKDRRFYDAGLKVGYGWIYEEDLGVKFEWEQITDNSYLITLPEDMVPGEYGFSFCKTRLSPYDFLYHIFAFTVPETQQ